MRSSFIAGLCSFALLTTPALSFKLSFYRSEGCRSEPLGEWVGGPNEGCMKVQVGNAESVIIKSTGEVDKDFTTVFFSSNDCNPDTEITHTDDGCANAKTYGSFQVWDLNDLTVKM